ncbi:hypothetical protein B0H19DRAFT_1230086 [Mycena capillaripes]|nr:hypothetical protein B0H19DRAFT_1230086 [Mycena capillaripes]
MSRRAIGSQTLNIHGGVGGNGGGSGLGQGGSGGNGEGPQLQYEIKAERFTMNNNLLNTTSGEPQSEFRVVNLGDLNLLDEIGDQKVVERRPTNERSMCTRSVTARRIYSARIFGSQDPMTAVVYNSPQFEQILAQAREKQHYRSKRCTPHPPWSHATLNVKWSVLCSVNEAFIIEFFNSSSEIWGAPVELIIVKAANLFWKSTTGEWLCSLIGTAWIRLSTGKLCVDVGNGDQLASLFPPWLVHRDLPSINFTDNDLDDKLLSRLKLDEFYDLLAYAFCDSIKLSSAPRTITLPSLCRIPDPGADFNADAEIPAIPIVNHFTPFSIYVNSWSSYAFPVEAMPTGWARVEYLGNPDTDQDLRMSIRFVDEDDAKKWWFSQQGYVLAQLRDPVSFHDEMVFVTGIHLCCTFNPPPDNFTLLGTFMADAPIDDVYLFLSSPKAALVDGRFIVTSPPAAEQYYWTFNPAGLDRLTCQMVEDLALPAPEFSIELGGAQLDETCHDMIRDFHVAKGFDPCSQDMAIAMGYPLMDLEDINKFARSLILFKTIVILRVKDPAGRKNDHGNQWPPKKRGVREKEAFAIGIAPTCFSRLNLTS